MQLLDTLHPQIEVSDLDFPNLPLCNFHIVIVAEPDPETWMAHPDDTGEYAETLEIHSGLILDELLEESWELSEINVKIAEDVERPIIVGVGELEIPMYYHHALEYAHVIISYEDMEYERLHYFLRGVAEQHPNWRVAVVGGVYEDEVVRVANTVQKAGFDTTIVTRYCISSHSLIDLDELFASITPEQHRRILEERGHILDVNNVDEDDPKG